MNIRSFGRTLLLILMTALPLQAKIDPRFLRGAYANLQSQYQKFSLFHGIAAAPKIENQLLYNNDTVTGQLVKQLFHQIQNQLTPPAAFSRPASYLSLHTLGLLIAAVHQNFPQKLEAEIKKVVNDAYQNAAQAENKVLNDKGKQAFNKDLAKIFELLKKGRAQQTEYDVYATLITLVYLKAGSIPDLEQYYQGLADGLTISVKDLFIQSDMIDDRPFSQQEIIQQFNILHVKNIDDITLQTLAQDPIEFEKSLAALLLINSGNQSLPKPFDYRGGVLFEGNGYPDCFEATTRNVVQTLLFDSTAGLCSLEKLRDYGINPDMIDGALKAFYQNPIQSGQHAIDPCNPVQAGDIACHNGFSAMISNRDWISYSNRTDGVCYMRVPQGVDYQEFLKASGKPVTVPAIMTHCSEVELSGQKITIFQADSPLKLYELTPSVKNFIIVFDQLLQLGLFAGEEDALEKVFWRDDFEKVYFDRLVKRFDWEYTSSKRNFKYNDGMPGATEVFHIKRAGCYRFYINFDRCADQPYHAEYHLQKDESKEQLNKIDVLEIAHHNQLFFNACATGAVIGVDRIKRLFSSNSEDLRIVDALYFCNLNDLAERLKIIESILVKQKITSEAISLAQKLFLAPAPREDYQYQNNIINTFTIIFAQNDANKNVIEKSNHVKQFINNNEVKKLLILIGMLRNNEKIIQLMLSLEATNELSEIKNVENLSSYIVEKYKPDFVISLIELLATYYGITPYLKSLCSFLLTKVTQTQAQQKLLDKLFVLYKKENTDDGNKTVLNQMLIQYPYGRELIMKFVQEKYSITDHYPYDIYLLNGLLSDLLNRGYSHEKILTFAQSLYQKISGEDINRSLCLFEFLVKHGFAFPEAMQVCAHALNKEKEGINVRLVIRTIEALIDRKQELESCFNAANKILLDASFENISGGLIKDDVLDLFQRLLKNGYSHEKILTLAQTLYQDENDTVKEKALYIFALLVKYGFAFSEAVFAGMDAIDNKINISAAGNIFKALCAKKECLDDCFNAATKLLALNSSAACSLFESLLEIGCWQEKILSFAQDVVQANSFFDQKETVNFFEILVERNLAFPGAAHIALHTVKNNASDLDKACKIFKILISKKQELDICFHAAINLLMYNNSEAFSLFRPLLKHGYSQDKFLSFAQELIQNSDSLQQKGAVNFFKLLVEFDIAFPQAAQVILYAVSNEVHLDIVCDLFKALVEKEHEIHTVSGIAYKLFKYNPNKIQPVFRKLFNHGCGFLEAAQCAEGKSDSYYSRNLVKNELSEYVKNNKESHVKIESIACAAMDTCDEAQLLGALVLFDLLLKENCACDSAALWAAEKAMLCSDSKVKKKAFEILDELYKNKAPKMAAEDADALLMRIASAAQQGVEDIGNCIIDYRITSLFNNLVEKGLAYDGAMKIVQAGIAKKESKGNVLELLEKLVDVGQYLDEALRIAHEVQLESSQNYRKISLFTALVKQNIGIEDALNFATQLASDGSLYDGKNNTSLYRILWLLEALIKQNHGFEITEQVSCRTLLNCTDLNITDNAYRVLQSLLKSNRALVSGEKVAIKMTQEPDLYKRGSGLQLFQIIVEKSSGYETAFQAAQQELARQTHDKTFDNRYCALGVFIELVKQNYQPAFELAFSTAMNLIQDEDWSNRYAAQKCFKELMDKGYLNQVKAFLAQFDREFPNQELQELAEYIKDQGPLGQRSDDDYNVRSLPPEPTRQHSDQNADMESEDDQDIQPMIA